MFQFDVAPIPLQLHQAYEIVAFVRTIRASRAFICTNITSVSLLDSCTSL